MKKRFVCIDPDSVARFENDEISFEELKESVYMSTADSSSSISHLYPEQIDLNEEESMFLKQHLGVGPLVKILEKFAQAGFALRDGI